MPAHEDASESQSGSPALTEERVESDTVGPGQAARLKGAHRVRAAAPEQLVLALEEQQAPVDLAKGFPAAGDSKRSRYLHQVAEGGMGIVHSALDTVLLRRFAQKTMRDCA